MKLRVPLSSVIFRIIFRAVIDAFVIYLAWNLGIAPMFHLGIIDWAGALAMAVLRMTCLGVTVIPVPVVQPISSNKAGANDEPPKTL